MADDVEITGVANHNDLKSRIQSIARSAEPPMCSLYIFHDRLEIVTPGGLPAGMRDEDFGVKSVPCNPLLFGMFYRIGMVEQVGSGIKRIREMCRDYGVAEPVIEVSENWVKTTFMRPNGQVEDQVAGEVTPRLPLKNELLTFNYINVLTVEGGVQIILMG